MGRLYTTVKAFHYRDKIESLPLDVDEIKHPIHIRIKPTNVCGHSCWYCSYKTDFLQLGKDMVKKDFIPKDKMMEIIDDIIEMGVNAVTFSGGGDPFYYPHLLDAVKKLAKSPVKFASLHNGSRLKGELAEVFAHHGTWVRVSIDGWDDKSYAEYRSIREGEFTKVMNNMENFKKLNGSCYLGISLIIDQKNAPHVFDFTKRLKNIGVDSVKMSAVVIGDDIEKGNLYHKGIFDSVKSQIKRAEEELADESFEVCDSYHELDKRFTKEYTWCPFLQLVPVIGADLNVYSCHDKAYTLGEGVLGSIKNQGFKDFWFEDKNKFFKINPSIMCNHHCTVNHKNKMIIEYFETDKQHKAFI